MSDAWPVLPLSAVADVKRNRIDPRNLGDRTLVHYSIPALDATDHPIHESASSIASHKFSVLQDSVLVSLLNPRIPRVWYAMGASDAVCSTEFAVLEPSTDVLTVPYLYYLCQSPPFVEELQKRAVGTTGSRQRTKADNLLSISISLPPPPVQRRIVDLITHLDKHLRNLRAESNAANQLLTSQRRSLLLGGNDWRDCSLGELVQSLDSKRRPVKASDRSVGLFPYYGASGIVDYVDSWIFDGEALLVAEDGANLRSRSTPIAFCADGRFWVNNHAHVLRAVDGNSNRFLAHLIEVVDLEDALTGTTMPKLNAGNLLDMKLSVPPQSVQEELAARLDANSMLGTSILGEIKRVQELRASLLAELLSGDIDILETYDSLLSEVA